MKIIIIITIIILFQFIALILYLFQINSLLNHYQKRFLKKKIFSTSEYALFYRRHLFFLFLKTLLYRKQRYQTL